MKIPFVAGSSVPFAWRFPQLELPRDTEIEAAVTIGYSDFESYGFHTLEAHQCMIERRKGGEGGLVSVQALTGEAILKSAAEGRWSRELFAAALAKFPGPPRDTGAWANEKSAVFLLEHRDGLKTAAVMANGLVEDFAFACKVKGRDEPLATWIKLQPGPPFGHFAYLLQGIEQTIHTAKPAWPLERTLLTTGALDRVMQSLAQKGKRLESPELAVAYTAADWPFANHPKATMTLSSD
jgi:hypothetical protein